MLKSSSLSLIIRVTSASLLSRWLLFTCWLAADLIIWGVLLLLLLWFLRLSLLNDLGFIIFLPIIALIIIIVHYIIYIDMQLILLHFLGWNLFLIIIIVVFICTLYLILPSLLWGWGSALVVINHDWDFLDELQQIDAVLWVALDDLLTRDVTQIISQYLLAQQVYQGLQVLGHLLFIRGLSYISKIYLREGHLKELQVERISIKCKLINISWIWNYHYWHNKNNKYGYLYN